MEHTTPSYPKTIFYISLITCLIFGIVILMLLVFLPSPSLLSYLGYADSVAIANSDNINDPFTSHVIGELVKSGTLISLKDIWAFQTSFYQTIITFLIAINGLIAALSVIYIKTTSEEKAEETTKKYMHSDSFDVLLNQKVETKSKLKLQALRSDFSSGLDSLAESTEAIRNSNERLELLENENKTLRQQLKVVIERVALLDSNESEGKHEILTRKSN